MPTEEAVPRRMRWPAGVDGGEAAKKPCAGWVAPNVDGVGKDERDKIRSCSSALRSVSRNNFSDREGGRGIGGRDKGDDGERGEAGLELGRARVRVFEGGEVVLVDMMGDGA